MLKTPIRFVGFFVALALMFGSALAPVSARAETAGDVPVKISAADKKTRIVFEFPKLTAYYSEKTTNGVALRFDTPLSLTAPAASGSITDFKIDKGSDGMVVAAINFAPEHDFKIFRLKRSIVMDISPKAEKPAPTDAPHKAEDKKEPPTTAITEPAEKHAPETPQEQKPEDEKNTVAAAPVPDAAPTETLPPPPDETALTPEIEETKITISSIEPMRLAVFRRFGTLWIVSDNPNASTFTPNVTGPQAPFLGGPKLFKFSDGTAWRYAMPEGQTIHIKRNNLTWHVIVTNDKPPQLSPLEFDTKVDEMTEKVKLMTEMDGVGKILSFEDPSVGDVLFVVPTNQETVRFDHGRRFPDIDIMPADLGLVVRPLADDISVNRLGSYVIIASPEGLKATPGAVSSITTPVDDIQDAPADATEKADEEDTADTAQRLFDFPNWRMGGIDKLYTTARDIEKEAAAAVNPDDRQAALMKLALLYFSNNYGHEALGVLRIIEDENEDMGKNPGFIALKGAANAMAGHYTEAIQFLSDPSIQQQKEVALWKGLAAAETEQWHLASQTFPKSTRLLIEYPDNIGIPITLLMAESDLRLGQVKPAKKLLESINVSSDAFLRQYKAQLDYLRGEALRQEGNLNEAEKLWDATAQGLDRLYHTKASLALANLRLQQNKITLKQAIDQVDSLRFAWRGDGLEVQILQNLGQLKIKNNQYLDGLEDWKTAIKLLESLDSDTEFLRADMLRVFSDLFIGNAAEKISPLEAASIYSGFSDLMPPGPDSQVARLKFADYLVSMDLLDKAEEIFEEQLKLGVPDAQAPGIGTKLAAIYLLDRKPSRALDALDATTRGTVDPALDDQRTLLRARAKSQLDRPDEAMAILEPMTSPEAQTLKVDVLWHAKKWSEAADNLEMMVPSPSEAISEDAAKLVVNLAVSAKLSGDAKRLNSLKRDYSAAMAKTKSAATFGVVTRDGGSSSLADAESLLKLAGEVDMFKDFLSNYKTTEAARSENTPPQSEAPAKEPAAGQ